jgi:hypothetical protein
MVWPAHPASRQPALAEAASVMLVWIVMNRPELEARRLRSYAVSASMTNTEGGERPESAVRMRGVTGFVTSVK